MDPEEDPITAAVPAPAGLAGSSVAGGSVHDHAQLRMTTRAQKGILKPSKFKDGIVRYEKNFKFANFGSSGEPQNLLEALSNDNWKKAMNIEYEALMKNQTWHLVSPKQGRNVIDCKWVYKIKRKPDGTIDRYKARLVAKGFKQ